MKRYTVAIAALTLLLVASGPASAAKTDLEGNWGLKILDVVLVRPVGIGVSTLSTGLFLGTLPLTALEGIAPGLAHFMVEIPWRFTSYRYLGHFNKYRDGGNIRGTGRRS